MRVPAAGQVRSEPARAFEIVLFLEQAKDHRRNLANLNMFETQLAMQAFRGRLGFRRSEPVPPGRSENALLFEGSVEPERLVEVTYGLAGLCGITRMSRSQESPEEIVQAAVLACQRLDERRVGAPDLQGIDSFTSADRERMTPLDPPLSADFAVARRGALLRDRLS